LAMHISVQPPLIPPCPALSDLLLQACLLLHGDGMHALPCHAMPMPCRSACSKVQALPLRCMGIAYSMLASCLETCMQGG
jgi:hypothetical protein